MCGTYLKKVENLSSTPNTPSCWLRPPVTLIFRTDSDSLTLETLFKNSVTLKLALLFRGECYSWKMKNVFHNVKSKNCWSIYRKKHRIPNMKQENNAWGRTEAI